MPCLVLTKMSPSMKAGKEGGLLCVSIVTHYSLQMFKRHRKSIFSLGGTRTVFSSLLHIRITWAACKTTPVPRPHHGPWNQYLWDLGIDVVHKPSNGHVHQGWQQLTNSFSSPVWLFASSGPGLTDWRGLHLRNTLGWEYFKVENTLKDM